MNSGNIVNGYHIIDVNKNPVLLNLREELYKRNPQAFDLMATLDTSGLLMSEGANNSGMLLNYALANSEYILFSSDKPYRKYGQYNVGDLIKAIGDLLSKVMRSSLSDKDKEGISDILMKLLKNISTPEEEGNSVIKLVLDAINGVNDFLDYVDKNTIKDILDSLDELKRISASLEFKRPLLGVHIDGDGANNPTGPFVILFLNNILGKEAGNEIFDVDELYNPFPNIYIDIERTYVHELFHMVHLGMEVLVSNNDYADKVVIEGLARYFEIYYSERYFGTNATNELDNLKLYYSVVSYPYVGACYIDRLDRRRFGEIVEKSTYGNHMAFHALLQGTKELDIIIKNL